MKVTGEKAVLKQIERLKKQVPEALRAAVYQEAVFLMQKSVPQVPVEHGTLRRSHYVTAPQGEDMTVELGYGTNYAIPVHERTHAHHHVGKAKFLEDPYNDWRTHHKERLAARARQNVEKGVVFQAGTMPEKPETSKSSSGPKRSRKR